MKKKVLSVFGTRPEAIKMAPVVKALEADENFESIVLVTAQHREMLDQVLEVFDIVPQYDMDIMKDRQTIAQITSRILEKMGAILEEVKPDVVLVHGDTTTTFAAALSAFYHQVKVGHVEAGLRSHNKLSPFPEEMNRSLTGRIADFHFAPTQSNYDNLIRENVDPATVFITGNTVIDALLMTVNKKEAFGDAFLDAYDFDAYDTLVVTAHRRENLGSPMINIFKALNRITAENPRVRIIFPIHKNPAVRELADDILKDNDHIFLIEPLEYKPFALLESKAKLILTDSGGIQEEAPALGIPVLVMRTETERPEAVDAGTVKVVGVDEEAIFSAAHELLNNEAAYIKMAAAVNPYGDGKASKRILSVLLEKL
jgi:UDP-N-acetylglucosamine 2-epimerase (non-hydrolysing)